MSRRRNYGFERRRREDQRRARLEAKQQRKSERDASGATGPEMGDVQDTGAPSGLWEWFSPSRSRTVTTPPRGHPGDEPPNDWVLLTDVADQDAPEG